jgi:hypothetical protein
LTNIDRQDEISTLAKKVDLATTQKTVNQLDYAIDQIEHYINARLVAEVLMLDLPYIE